MIYALTIDRTPYSVYRINPHDFNFSLLESQEKFYVSKMETYYSVIAKTGTLQRFEKEESGWKGLSIDGVIDFKEFNVLSKLLNILAEIEVSVLIQSSYDTDTIFIKATTVQAVREVLIKNGYGIQGD